jgi:hypothetical protein
MLGGLRSGGGDCDWQRQREARPLHPALAVTTTVGGRCCHPRCGTWLPAFSQRPRRSDADAGRAGVGLRKMAATCRHLRRLRGRCLARTARRQQARGTAGDGLPALRNQRAMGASGVWECAEPGPRTTTAWTHGRSGEAARDPDRLRPEVQRPGDLGGGAFAVGGGSSGRRRERRSGRGRTGSGRGGWWLGTYWTTMRAGLVAATWEGRLRCPIDRGRPRRGRRYGAGLVAGFTDAADGGVRGSNATVWPSWKPAQARRRTTSDVGVFGYP